MWADWLWNPDQFTCEECRELAEANGDEPECDTCPKGKELVYTSQINYDAINSWNRLNLFGRDIDSFGGVPLPLKLAAIEIECNGYPDPIGLKWRIMLFEENIYAMRMKKYNADSKKKNKK